MNDDLNRRRRDCDHKGGRGKGPDPDEACPGGRECPCGKGGHKDCRDGFICTYPDISTIDYKYFLTGETRFWKAVSYAKDPKMEKDMPRTFKDEGDFDGWKSSLQEALRQNRSECAKNKAAPRSPCRSEKQGPEGGFVKEKCMDGWEERPVYKD